MVQDGSISGLKGAVFSLAGWGQVVRAKGTHKMEEKILFPLPSDLFVSTCLPES